MGNNLNISNIINIMNRPAIAEYILESNNINHNFINTCIQTYLIQDDFFENGGTWDMASHVGLGIKRK